MAGHGARGRMQVTLLTPGEHTPGTFFELFGDLAGAAARQLDIDLRVVHATREHQAMLARGREAVAGPHRPDYMLVVNQANIGLALLPLYSSLGVKTFFVVETLTAHDLKAMRASDEDTAGYMGHVVPDDVEAGRMLGEMLATTARDRGLVDDAGKVRVGVIAGAQTQASSARFQGLRTYLAGSDAAVQAAFHYGAFKESSAKSVAALMLHTDPGLGALWCASDAMALGALAAAVEAGRRPGTDVVLGGIDLLERALAEVVSGRLEVTIGGHVADGAHALVLVHDQHWTGAAAPEERTTRPLAVRAPDAERYLRFMRQRAWLASDFTRFSRVRNPGAAASGLSVDDLVSR